MKRQLTIVLTALGIATAPLLCAAQSAPLPPKYDPDATLASTPANVVWGYIPVDGPRCSRSSQGRRCGSTPFRTRAS